MFVYYKIKGVMPLFENGDIRLVMISGFFSFAVTVLSLYVISNNE